jgi:hypothetical protein
VSPSDSSEQHLAHERLRPFGHVLTPDAFLDSTSNGPGMSACEEAALRRRTWLASLV